MTATAPGAGCPGNDTRPIARHPIKEHAMTTAAHRLLAALLLLGGLLAAPSPAKAAETYNTCAGFIDSVPATISKQGVWCLRKNLTTNVTLGYAITIATNNVTIDCNGFKIGGLAAGNGAVTAGVYADNRQNATVRNCNIRGFYSGIHLEGDDGAGHLVEDNRLDNNLYCGIFVEGDNNLIRRNRIYDTGGATGKTLSFGIDAYADIIDNTVSGLFIDRTGYLFGVFASGAGANIRDNKISGFDMTTGQGGSVTFAAGITLAGNRQRAAGNQVVGGDVGSNISGFGIDAGSDSYCRGNDVGGFAGNNIRNCGNISDNLIGP